MVDFLIEMTEHLLRKTALHFTRRNLTTPGKLGFTITRGSHLVPFFIVDYHSKVLEIYPEVTLMDAGIAKEIVLAFVKDEFTVSAATL